MTMDDQERERLLAQARATTPEERLAAVETLLWELGVVARADEMRRAEEARSARPEAGRP